MTKTSYPHLMFVYGTLQKGHSNNRVMIGNSGLEATLLGSATTMPKFYMTGGGFPRVGFPASTRALDYLGQVRGEVWCVNDSALKACDRLEGHPRFYCREVVPVTLDKDRTRLRPWMYLIVDPFRAYECMEKDKSGLLVWKSAYKAFSESF
jgi:gamma-glutamylaminecyclotransferase